MLSRIALLLLSMVLATQAVAATRALLLRAICSQSTPTIRKMWLKGVYDAPPTVATLMVDAIDGKLPAVRQQLQDMKPADATRWRQSAMITAAWAGQTAVVDGLLDDGAAVDGNAWIPPFKPGFFGKTVDAMKHDSRFGNPAAVREMRTVGVLANQGKSMGPALTVAAECGDLATLDVLLQHHANAAQHLTPNTPDALTVATVGGDAPIVGRLLDHGAKPCDDDRRIASRRPGTSLVTIGRKNGFPESLAQRLACPGIAGTH